jgi:hypothetical protein
VKRANAALTLAAAWTMFLASASPACAQSAQPGSLDSIDFGVALCLDPNSPQAVDATVSAAVRRAVAPAANGKKVGYRVLPCQGAISDASCFAQEKVLVCRTSVIERILRLAAWAALAYERSGKSSYDAFRLQVPRWSVEAVRYADGAKPDAGLDKASKPLREAYRRYQSSGAATGAVALTKSELLFTALVDFTLAALIGHELSHVAGERCPIQDRARVEESGLISRLISLHQTGELFCLRSPSPEEVRADVCGMRHIQRAEVSFGSSNADDGTMHVARRLSADIIAFEIIFGWRPRPGVPIGTYGFIRLDEYLYEPMRVLAFGAELGPNGPGESALCGEAASLFVHGTQELVKSCKEAKGIIADDILALLPKNVETSWNGGAWSSASFNCGSK